MYGILTFTCVLSIGKAAASAGRLTRLFAGSKVVVLGSGWGASTFMKNLAPRVTDRAPLPAMGSVPCLLPRLDALGGCVYL